MRLCHEIATRSFATDCSYVTLSRCVSRVCHLHRITHSDSCARPRCARRVAVSRVLRTLRLAPLALSAHKPALNSAQRKPRRRSRYEGSRRSRYAARTSRASPSQEPPRSTRGADAGSAADCARLLAIVLHPNILAPLPDIPQHVVQAPGIRFLAGDRVGLVSAVRGVPSDFIRVFPVARRFRPRAAGVFPLRLRRERQPETINP